MKKTIVSMMMCGVLLAGAAVAADGGEKASAPVGTVEAHVFNVLKYGAVGDDKTDNTAAFSACLKAMVEAGGGKMVLPDGVYRGRIVIPPVSKPLPSWITVEIAGESEPTPVFGTIGNFPLQNKGTIVKCLETAGPAVISASRSPQSLYGGFSAVYVVIRNLDVRTYNNPAISGIDLHFAMQCRLENVFVNEHTDGDNINLASTINGLEFAFGHHASRFGRVGAQRCTHAVAVTGKHGFMIDQLDMEIAGKNQTDSNNVWQATAYNLNDPGNLGIGDITYWVVEGNVGAVEKFTRNGGASIQARRIGEKP